MSNINELFNKTSASDLRGEEEKRRWREKKGWRREGDQEHPERAGGHGGVEEQRCVLSPPLQQLQRQEKRSERRERGRKRAEEPERERRRSV